MEHQKSSYTCVRIIDDSMDNEFPSAVLAAFVLNAHIPFPSYLNAYYPTPLLIFSCIIPIDCLLHSKLAIYCSKADASKHTI